MSNQGTPMPLCRSAPCRDAVGMLSYAQHKTVRYSAHSFICARLNCLKPSMNLAAGVFNNVVSFGLRV